MFCKYCGSTVEKGSTFCKNCGRDLPNQSSPNLSYTSHFTSAMEKKRQPQGNSKTVALIVIISALLLLVILAIILLLASPSSTSDATPTQAHNYTLPTAGTVPQSSGNLSSGNPYYNILMSYSSYVLPDSDKSYLCYTDLSPLNQDALKIAQEEIHARHGQTFSDSHLQEYFEACSWYKPNSGSSNLNEYEKANLELIRVFLAKQNGSLYQSGNKYFHLISQASQYLLRSSSSSPISGNELKEFSADKLFLAKNEIYARHGCIFNDPALQEYFYSMEWYRPSQSVLEFSPNKLSTVERNNLALIEVYETIVQGDLQWSADNPYRVIFYDYSPSDYIIYDSSSVYLTENDLIGMSADELCLARNEIFARHGYSFQAPQLMEYFLHHDWYVPNTPFGDSSSIYFTQLEYDNIDLLNEAENAASETYDRVYRGSSKINLSNLDTSLTYTVSNEKFSVRLPAYFRDHGLIQTQPLAIRCHEKYSYQSFGGHVYSFEIGTYEDYHYLPSYRVIGTLTDSSTGKQYDLYIFFPTDVQFDMPYMALYSKMEKELERIIPTITGVNGWVFSSN